MHVKLFLALSFALPAAVSALALGFERARKPEKAPDAIVLDCAILQQITFAVEVLLEAGALHFLDGPYLAIIDQRRTGAGGVTLRASNALYELDAMLDETITFRFRSVPGNFDDLRCSRIGRDNLRESGLR